MENNSPLVSVTIPAYNRVGKNFEIIVVDDGSKDNTRNALISYGDK